MVLPATVELPLALVLLALVLPAPPAALLELPLDAGALVAPPLAVLEPLLQPTKASAAAATPAITGEDLTVRFVITVTTCPGSRGARCPCSLRQPIGAGPPRQGCLFRLLPALLDHEAPQRQRYGRCVGGSSRPRGTQCLASRPTFSGGPATHP